ncbi:hypothetical protein J4474_04385 [Candidatus Pacearchaeota archaeon]|nr:hypothetical protein [Candidatus Pacearchaeota archaeon]
MTYNSLLTQLDNQRTQPWVDYQFNMGGLTDIDSVIKTLRESDSIENKVFCPHKILRGLLNHKEEYARESNFCNKKGNNLIKLINEAMDFCMEVYSGKNYEQNLDKLKIEIDNYFQYFKRKAILEIDDHVSWTSTHPDLNKSTAKLLSQFPSILMIPMAHGSLRAATDIFLRYKDMKPESDSVIYPVRFSTRKLCDCKPKLWHVECEYLIEKSSEREVILFDEDIFEGGTMVKAIGFFEQIFGKRVTAMANTSRHTKAGIISRDDLKILSYRGEWGVKL